MPYYYCRPRATFFCTGVVKVAASAEPVDGGASKESSLSTSIMETFFDPVVPGTMAALLAASFTADEVGVS